MRVSVQGDDTWLTAEKDDGSQHVEAASADVLADVVGLLESRGRAERGGGREKGANGTAAVSTSPAVVATRTAERQLGQVDRRLEHGERVTHPGAASATTRRRGG